MKPRDDTETLDDLGISKVRSERRMGEILENMPKQEGYRTPTGLQNETPLLQDLGISKVRSERRMGEILGKMEKNKGVRMDGTRRLHDETTETLQDLGISKIQSHRYQQLAKIKRQRRQDIKSAVIPYSLFCLSSIIGLY